MTHEASQQTTVANLLLPAAERIAATLEVAFSQRLLSLAVYGSAAQGGYRVGSSDLNLLIILDRVDPDDLAVISGVVGQERRARPQPAVLSERDLAALAADSPATLWDIADHHLPIAGRDLVSELDFSLTALAAQLRFEVRDKLLRLRHQALGCGETAQLALAVETFPSILHLLRAGTRLYGQQPPGDPVGAVGSAARVLRADLALLQTLYGIRYGDRRPDKKVGATIFRDYLAMVADFADLLDSVRDTELPLVLDERGRRPLDASPAEPPPVSVEAKPAPAPEADDSAPAETAGRDAVPELVQTPEMAVEQPEGDAVPAAEPAPVDAEVDAGPTPADEEEAVEPAPEPTPSDQEPPTLPEQTASVSDLGVDDEELADTQPVVIPPELTATTAEEPGSVDDEAGTTTE